MSPTGFIDWAEFARLNEESQREALTKQVDALRGQAGEASHLLSQSKWDAQQRQMRESQTGNTDTQLSSVGSYSDYLRAKQGMREGLARLMRGDGGDFGALQQQILSGGLGQEARNLFEEIQGKEMRFSMETQQSGEGANALGERTRATADAKAAAEAKRQSDFDETARGFYGDVQRKWRDANALQPFGRPGENRSDQTQLARMLAVGRAGGQWAPQSEEQNRQVNAQAWQGGSGNAYGADFKQVKNPTRDQYGRAIDPKTGRPITGTPMY